AVCAARGGQCLRGGNGGAGAHHSAPAGRAGVSFGGALGHSLLYRRVWADQGGGQLLRRGLGGPDGAQKSAGHRLAVRPARAAAA
nr:hypothetical protein [Tanacetum cinerariifolium]